MRLVGIALIQVFAMLICLVLIWFFLALPTHARDLDGKYSNNPLHAWFDSLRSGKGLCCSFADGEQINDVDWETKDGHYRVRLDGQWFDVPDDAVITEPNKFGPAVVWPIRYDGKVQDIRCFMPGAGA